MSRNVTFIETPGEAPAAAIDVPSVGEGEQQQQPQPSGEHAADAAELAADATDVAADAADVNAAEPGEGAHLAPEASVIRFSLLQG